MLAAPCGGSPYLRMWRGGRPTVSIVNGCGYEAKETGLERRPGGGKGVGGGHSLQPQILRRGR
jgi:hypothetical protein